jgi:hypothetical protein
MLPFFDVMFAICLNIKEVQRFFLFLTMGIEVLLFVAENVVDGLLVVL